MFRSTRRFLVLAITSALSLPSAAFAGFTAITTTPQMTAIAAPATSGGLLQDKGCSAPAPAIYELRVIGAPTAGTGNTCTNDLQCTLGEACVFPFPINSSTTGTCQSSGHLARGDIHYVAGNQVDVEVTIPACTSVSRVQGVTLYGGSDGIDTVSAPVSWAFLPSGPSTTVNGQPAIRQRVRIQFINLGDGATGSMPIEVRGGGGLTTTRSFTLAGVEAVNAAMRTTVAETAIRNSFVTGIYEKFGDYEQFYNDKGELAAYDVDWSELSSTGSNLGPIRWRGTDLRVRTDKLVFAAGFKGAGKGCDPNVYVNGEFRLVPSGDGLDLEWLHGPIGTTDAPNWCFFLTAATWEWVLGYFTDEKGIAAPFGTAISDELGADEAGHISVCPGCRVADVKIGSGKIEVWTVPPSERVRVNVSTTRLQDATANTSTGLLIPAGFYAPIIGGGSFESCVPGNGIPATCDKITVDMNGAFNWWGNDVPVPDSIAYDPVYGAVVLGGRANARERLRGVLRHTTELPAPAFRADTLIVRRSPAIVATPPARARVANGCVLPPVTGSAYRIAFGVNDRPSTPPTQGKLVATVLLARTANQTMELFGSSDVCVAEPITGGTRGGVQTSGTLMQR